jgi:ribose transport system ATP-binding protein
MSEIELRSAGPILEMRNISKTFGKLRALRNVQFSAAQGEIHALMGENGAGKSTLMKILAGAIRPDAGSEISIGGTLVAMTGPMAAKALGIAVIYQELSLSPNLSVAENIYLGRELRGKGLAIGWLDRAAMIEGSAEVLRRLGASFTAEAKVCELTLAERRARRPLPFKNPDHGRADDDAVRARNRTAFHDHPRAAR